MARARKSQPSHPSTHNSNRLDIAYERAKQDRETYRQEKQKGGKPLSNNSSTVYSDPVSQTSGTARIAEEISSALEGIYHATQAVQASRFRLVQQRLPYKPKHKPVAQETPERAVQAREGIAVTTLPDGTKRASVRTPMGLSTDIVGQELRGAAKKNEPPVKRSRFDKALDHEDGPILRWALSRYIVDRQAIEAKGQIHDQMNVTVSCSNSPENRLPYNETQRKAYGRIDFVHKRLSPKDKKDLSELTKMVSGVEDSAVVMSVAEFGAKKSGMVDAKVQEGVAIGCWIKIAERLHDIYRLRELPLQLIDALPF